MSTRSAHTHAEIVAAFGEQQIASVAYWDTFDTATFFRPIGSSWSPAQTVRHLTKSTRPVVKALAMPAIVLRILFGTAKRHSMTYDQVVSRYRQALAEGGRAGRFAPSQRSADDLGAWRRTIMAEFVAVDRELRKRISQWHDKQLDRFLLPHPLLGKLTVREMLFFTLYHQQHHIGVIERRVKGAAEAAG